MCPVGFIFRGNIFFGDIFGCIFFGGNVLQGQVLNQSPLPFFIRLVRDPMHPEALRGAFPHQRVLDPVFRTDEEERAGRWAGSDKLECGLHLENIDKE